MALARGRLVGEPLPSTRSCSAARCAIVGDGVTPAHQCNLRSGSTIEGSSFAGVLTRVEIGHIRIKPAGKWPHQAVLIGLIAQPASGWSLNGRPKGARFPPAIRPPGRRARGPDLHPSRGVCGTRAHAVRLPAPPMLTLHPADAARPEHAIADDLVLARAHRAPDFLHQLLNGSPAVPIRRFATPRAP